MARDTRRAFLEELAKVEPRVAQAFGEAIADIRSTAQSRVIEEAIRRALESRDIGRGVREVTAALQLGAEFFAPLDRTIAEAFETGAIWQLSTLPKKTLPNTGPLLVRLKGRHPRAEAWTRNRAAALITEISQDQQQVIRETITEAVEQTRPSRKVAQDLIGQTEGNQRRGGMIGLHSTQARAVRSARVELENLDAAYFRRARRNRIHDRTIRKAIREGRSLTSEQIAKFTRSYSDRLLRLRAETIAKTEGNKAANAGRAEAITQMIEKGIIPEAAVTKIWDATPGPRTRDSHRALNGTSMPWGQKFVSPITGAEIAYPHDDTAPAAETVNCRCSARFRINWAMLEQ